MISFELEYRAYFIRTLESDNIKLPLKLETDVKKVSVPHQLLFLTGSTLACSDPITRKVLIYAAFLMRLSMKTVAKIGCEDEW